jgi:hypothetical protein
MELSGRLKGTIGRGLWEKKGVSKGKLANCTKMPVWPESAMRTMRVDKTEWAEGRLERCSGKVGDKGGEKGND